MKRLILALLVCAARGLCIASAEGVIANVASRGFDVFLRTDSPPASCRLEIYRDAAGTQPETAVTIERQALFTGATSGDDYARRCADRQIRSAMTACGNLLFRVDNATLDTVYHVRVVADDVTWPASGLQEVRTLPIGAWRPTTHQTMIDVHRPGDGWVGVLTVLGAYAPLLAVCGDGTPTNTCFFFNYADLADETGEPFTPVAGTPMTFRLYGRGGAPATQRTMTYAAPDAQDAAVAVLSTEVAPLLRLMIASAAQSVTEPAPGENFFFDGSAITCRVAQTTVTQVDTQFVAYGWSGSGSVPVSGRTTAFTFALSADSEVIWNWRTNYWLDVVAEHGVVDLSPGWYRAGASLSAQATPDAEWLFDGWSGMASGSDPVTAFTVSSPGQLVAAFQPVLVPGGQGMPEWWLTQAGLVGADRDIGADPDNDGMSNLQEWLADTSPTNRASNLRITALSKNGVTANLTWQGGREAMQIVEMLEGDLATGTWRPVSTNLPPTETIGTCAIQIEGKPTLFFRIKAER